MAVYDQQGTFDDGLTYDQGYKDSITSEHQKPDFQAVIQTLTQGHIDNQALLAVMPYLFDLDNAAGAQLDIVGQWIGVSRNLPVPLTGVYFSFDIDGLGWNEGTIKGPFDPTTELDVLPDDAYRQLLRTKIANNQWDGTIPGAYKFMADVFPGNTFFIQDNQDMSILIGVVGPNPLNAVSTALLEGGFLKIKPAGVRVNGYASSDIPGAPLFGFDAQNSIVSGWDTGCIATITGGN